MSALHDIGDALRQRRKELGLTQQQAASLAGISRGYLSEIERGRRDLSVTIFLEIARALQLQCRWVPFGDAHTRSHAAMVDDATAESALGMVRSREERARGQSGTPPWVGPINLLCRGIQRPCHVLDAPACAAVAAPRQCQ